MLYICNPLSAIININNKVGKQSTCVITRAIQEPKIRKETYHRHDCSCVQASDWYNQRRPASSRTFRRVLRSQARPPVPIPKKKKKTTKYIHTKFCIEIESKHKKLDPTWRQIMEDISPNSRSMMLSFRLSQYALYWLSLRLWSYVTKEIQSKSDQRSHLFLIKAKGHWKIAKKAWQ